MLMKKTGTGAKPPSLYNTLSKHHHFRSFQLNSRIQLIWAMNKATYVMSHSHLSGNRCYVTPGLCTWWPSAQSLSHYIDPWRPWGLDLIHGIQELGLKNLKHAVTSQGIKARVASGWRMLTTATGERKCPPRRGEWVYSLRLEHAVLMSVRGVDRPWPQCELQLHRHYIIGFR